MRNILGCWSVQLRTHQKVQRILKQSPKYISKCNIEGDYLGFCSGLSATYRATVWDFVVEFDGFGNSNLDLSEKSHEWNVSAIALSLVMWVIPRRFPSTLGSSAEPAAPAASDDPKLGSNPSRMEMMESPTFTMLRIPSSFFLGVRNLFPGTQF